MEDAASQRVRAARRGPATSATLKRVRTGADAAKIRQAFDPEPFRELLQVAREPVRVPGHELVVRTLADLDAGAVGAESCLAALGARRRRRLGGYARIRGLVGHERALESGHGQELRPDPRPGAR